MILKVVLLNQSKNILFDKKKHNFYILCFICFLFYY